MRTNNLLSHETFFALCKAVEGLENKAILASQTSAARLFRQQLGVEITEANVKHAIKVTGVVIPAPVLNVRRTNGKTATRGHQVRTVARSLISLCESLGHEPNNLDALLKVAEYQRGRDK